jgi:hypothetical protein
MANLFAKAKTSAPAKQQKEKMRKQEFLFKMLHFSESKTRIFTRCNEKR